MIGSRNWSAVWKFEDWFVKKWKNFQTPIDKSKNIFIFDTSNKIEPERFDC